MIDFLYSIDLAVFYFFNHTLSCGALNKFFTLITEVNSWIIAYVILWGICFFKGGRKGKIAAVSVIFLIIISDQIGYRILKEYFGRIRPCIALHDAILPIGPTGAFSFPSNHALNNFAAATYFTRFFPKLKWIMFVTAFFIALSRVYLGLHYPSDILGGAIIGIIIGYYFAELVLLFEKKTNKSQTVVQP
jgi:Membrane-associated phospholipid phosphatase